MPFALRPPSRPRPIRPRLGTRFLRAAGSGITARTATVAESASATTVTGTRPADRQTGDYVVAHFAMTCTPAQFTGPGGSWTQLVAPTADSAAVSTVAVYGMFDPASDPVGSMSAAAGRVTCLMQAYGGVDPTTPVDVAAVTSAGTLPLTVTQVTTVTAGARLISGTSANFSTGTWTVPAGMGLVRTHTSGTGRGSALADEVRPTAGATGTRQWTADVLQGAVGYLLALRPAPMPVVREYLASEASAVNTSVTTGAGTQAGDLLLVFHSNNANTAANLTAPTTGSWTLLATGDGGASGAHVKAWSGTATGGAQTITVAPTVSGEEHGIHVVVFAGACTVDGAAGGNGTGTALHVSPAVSPVGSPRMLFSVAVSTGAVGGNYLPPPGMAEGTELDDATFTYTSSLGSETLLNSGSTGARTWTYSTSAGTYATASVAVKGVAAAGGSNATATPSTVAAVAAIDTLTVQVGSVVTPGTVAATAAVGAPTVQAGATATPATVAGTATIDAVTVRLGAAISPATVAATASIATPAVQVGGNATVTPSTVAATAAVGAPSVSTGAGIVPATVSAVATVGAPAVRLSVAITPATVAATTAVGASVSTGSTVTATTVAATTAIPAPTVKAGAGAAPSTVAATATVGSGTVQAGAVVTPSTVAAVASVGAPSLGGSVTATPSTVAAVSAITAPTVQAGSNVSASVVAATAAVPSPTVQAGARPVPATVAAVAAIGTPSVGQSALVSPATVAAVATVPVLTIRAGAVAAPATVAATAVVGAPAVKAGATIPVATVAGVATIPAPTVSVVRAVTHRPFTGTTARPGSGTTARPFAGTTFRP